MFYGAGNIFLGKGYGFEEPFAQGNIRRNGRRKSAAGLVDVFSLATYSTRLK
jgi:hypothetical protein